MPAQLYPSSLKMPHVLSVLDTYFKILRTKPIVDNPLGIKSYSCDYYYCIVAEYCFKFDWCGASLVATWRRQMAADADFKRDLVKTGIIIKFWRQSSSPSESFALAQTLLLSTDIRQLRSWWNLSHLNKLNANLDVPIMLGTKNLYRMLNPWSLGDNFYRVQ